MMLGVIGAEFGHEIEPNRRKVEITKKSKKEQEGFTLSNYSLSRHTSEFCLQIAIVFLFVPSWPLSYGSWIYNYLCNECLSPLML